MTREPFPADMLCRAIARRLHIIADTWEGVAHDGGWDDFPKVNVQTVRLMAAMLHEVATAIEEESRR